MGRRNGAKHVWRISSGGYDLGGQGAGGHYSEDEGGYGNGHEHSNYYTSGGQGGFGARDVISASHAAVGRGSPRRYTYRTPTL